MNNNVTYRELLNWLKILEADESQMLDLTVTVKDHEANEWKPVDVVMVTHEANVLPADHPYLVLSEKPVQNK